MTFVEAVGGDMVMIDGDQMHAITIVLMDEINGIGHCCEQLIFDLGFGLYFVRCPVVKFCSGPSSGSTKGDGPHTGTKI